MTKVAFPVTSGRIAPVFDVAGRMKVVEVEEGTVTGERSLELPAAPPIARVLMMADAGIDQLVCGAISRPLMDMVFSYGISVVPFISGEIGRVIEAFIEGDLESNEFMMPGCRRGRRRKEDPMMQGAGRGGGRGGGGGGRGMGRGGGRGRMGGPAAGGPGGACMCPACGHREPHEAGVPCNSRQCPECGAAMTREVR